MAENNQSDSLDKPGNYSISSTEVPSHYNIEDLYKIIKLQQNTINKLSFEVICLFFNLFSNKNNSFASSC